MKNDVWEVVPRPDGKSAVTFDGFTKLNMEEMVAWENIRPYLLPKHSLIKKELTMMNHELLWLNILPSEPSLLLL